MTNKQNRQGLHIEEKETHVRVTMFNSY